MVCDQTANETGGGRAREDQTRKAGGERKAEKELEKWKEEKRIKAKAKREAASLVAQQASRSSS